MPAREFTVTVSEDTLQPLEAVYGNDDDRLRAVLSLAIEQWTATMFGRTRYRSLTELFLSWLQRLFTDPVPLEPTLDLLYGAFSFPYGQAAYLSRVLQESQPRLLRLRHIGELEVTLAKRREDAEKLIEAGRADERLSFVVSKFARRELENLLARLHRTGKQVHTLRVEGTFGDFVSLLLVAADLEPILGAIAEVRAELTTLPV